MNKCDVCGIENDTVAPGRWIFYCPEHKQNDWEHTYANEIENVDDIDSSDGELSEMILENM